jgi:DNA-binding FrmR family transcriptional regulator
MAHQKKVGDTDELVSRLRKIEGQVRGVQRMLDEDAYCVDVLTQISAVISGMEKVALRLLGDHMRGCVTDAMRSKDRGEEKVEEVVKVVERFLAS